ncbi:GNAT family N-acetyltransferase [Sedimentibacter sp.]|uniref:GNAT family N-acetyltransferase n=1 Tax=Sedimentibacter sp. TaxID=1960295 RepID=UPI000ED350C8|nr:GNAT family N-acetyltransferase [Sedimentibacter sp.]HCX62546.1 N-acetyltransferase [Clostridiales bacterium]
MLIIKDIPFSEVSIIKDLWEKNRKYHENISEYFGFLYTDLVFEERINTFDVYDKKHIKISIAENNGKLSGYCISTFEGTNGETHTLHVDVNERNNGIGRKLMDAHINWLKNNGCKSINITVAIENTNTIDFYKSLGFRANTLEMKLT